MNCETCKQKQSDPVPYIVHESAMARAERANKRLWIALILVIVLLVGSNIGWMIYESQFEDVVTTTQEVEQIADDGGNNRFVGGDYYGAAESTDNND